MKRYRDGRERKTKGAQLFIVVAAHFVSAVQFGIVCWVII